MNPLRACHAVLAAVWLGIALFLPSSPADAASDADTCLMCHGDKDAKGSGGNAIAVDGEAFAHSVHGEVQIGCTGCHTDVNPAKLPHPEKLKPVQCANCHADAAKAYAVSVHSKARRGGNDVAAGCTNCHGKHDIKKASNPASRTNHANIEATCGQCHGNDTVVLKAHLPGGNIVSQFHDSIHGKALKGAAQASAPTCSNCHGAHSIREKANPESRTNRANIPDTCGSCHQPVQAAFNSGQHGKLHQGGNLAAPVCSDCHTAHGIQQRETPGFVTGVVNECGTCHQEYLSTYRDTFHGQVTALGYAQAATCASCHGAHQILPASDPASRVSVANRIATCQTCHPRATANFVSFDPHANVHDRTRNPLYWWAAKFMEWLLIGVFGFFGIHTILWLGRELYDRFGPRK